MGPNLVLVGFMGTGKTEVGKAVSERLGKTFVDIDDQIVKSACFEMSYQSGLLHYIQKLRLVIHVQIKTIFSRHARKIAKAFIYVHRRHIIFKNVFDVDGLKIL